MTTSNFATATKMGGRILVVDDNEFSRYARSYILRQSGYSVQEAANGYDALRQVEEDPPDLILLDVRLPDISGFEVCHRIKANSKRSQVLVLQISAVYPDDRSKITGLQSGADGYLSEPVEPSLLAATIAAFMRISRAEKANRAHAVEWQATFNAIRDGVALTDAQGTILRWNRALAAFARQPGSDLTGARIEELFPWECGCGTIWENLEKGQRQYAECRAGERVLSLAVDPVRDDHGAVRAAVCIVSDVTEPRTIHERLWHQQKLESIGLLAGGIAHDFNNILVGILGNASLGLERLDDRTFTERAFRDILCASERAADLTRQLLAYAGKGKVVVQPSDLSEIVAGVLPLIKASIPSKVEVVLNLESHLPAVNVDKTQIEQIVMNLLINAAEAIGENPGTVTVKTRSAELAEDVRQNYLSESEVRGRYAVLEVSDTGIGMDEETLKHIFDPFFTTKFMGRGLGLSAVMGIVRGHGGAIRVRSAPGQGARFEILLPGTQAETRSPQAAAPEVERAAGGGTILVIDDEPIVREFFQAALHHHGYEAVLAGDGEEALRVFSEQADRFELVVLDLVMPGVSGKDLLPRLLEVKPEVRIVVTSGQVEEEVRRELAGWKIAGFIHKPCTSRTLVAQIQRAMQTENGEPP
jgi:PAS domain S-box-containing protein